MYPTNPFPLAFAAITSPNARAYYAMRAQQDFGLLVWAIASIATLAYQLGEAVADELSAAAESVQPEPQPQLMLATATVIGYLPPAREPAPQHVRVRPRALTMADAWVGTEVLITPAPVLVAPKAKRQAKPKTRPTRVRKALRH